MKSNIAENFYGQIMTASSVSQIDTFLSIIPRTPQYMRIRQAILYSKVNLVDRILNLNTSTFSIQQINRVVPAFRIHYQYGGENKTIEGGLVILPTNYSNIFRITSLSYGNFWRIAVRKIIRNIYPHATPVFFKQNEIQKALLVFENSLGPKYQLQIAEATLKEQKEDNEQNHHKRVDTHRYWTSQPIKDVFEIAENNDEWFTSLKVKIKQLNPRLRRFVDIGVLRIYKKGEINYDFLYDPIRENLLNSFEFSAFKRFSLFSDRSLSKNSNFKVKPLEINYKEKVFDQIDEIHRFKKVIEKYPNSSTAIYHGNPYFHIGLADFKDGSSFELWILSSNQILLIPQGKSSAEALERLISYISTSFLEGEVIDINE